MFRSSPVFGVRCHRFGYSLSLLLFAVSAHAAPAPTLSASPNPVDEKSSFVLTADIQGGKVSNTRYEQISPTPSVLFDGGVSLSVPVVAPAVGPGGITQVYRLTVTTRKKKDVEEESAVQAVEESVVVRNVLVPPSASAGADFTVAAQTPAQLNGSGADANGSIVSYAWTQSTGEPVTLSDPARPSTSFTAPASAGALTFVLTVTDDDGQTASSTVVVTVQAKDKGSKNRPPVVDAGPDRAVSARATVTLQGTASDPDGTAVSVSWTQVSGPRAIDINSNAALQAFFTAPDVEKDELYVFRLTGSDGSLAASDSVVVTVQAKDKGDKNRPPVVNAGPDRTVSARATVTLQGTASDPDGTAVSVLWTQVSGPRPIDIKSESALQAFFVAPDVEKDELYVFRLSGSDGFLTTSDSVTVHVLPQTASTPPAAPPVAPAAAAPVSPIIANPKVFPSPFNPSSGGATIGYTLRSPADVTVLISDIFGRQVREIHAPAGTDGGAAGDNRLSWDGRSGDGEPVGNGAYVVQIRAHDGSAQGAISDRVGVRR